MKTTWIAVLLMALMPGCTTTAAKKAMNKPNPDEDVYVHPSQSYKNPSERKAEEHKAIGEDTEPEQAIGTLVEWLQKDRSYQLPAEEQLKYWGAKQGLDTVVVGKVRPLLKNERIEVRAPALRLTVLFGKADSNGDLIECLADSEYGIRDMAYRALKARAKMDFGFDPGGGQVEREQAVEAWRAWWQAEQAKATVQAPSIYEQKPPTEPTIVAPGKEAGK